MSIDHPQNILILLAGGKSSRAEKIKGLRVINNNYWIDVVLNHYQQMGLIDTFVGLGYNHNDYLGKSYFLNNPSTKIHYSINKNPVEGSFSTLQVILKKAINFRWDFALISHIDCALVSENTIKTLLKETNYTVVKPIINDKSGHPIKLSRDFCKTLVMKSKNSQLDKEIKQIKKSRICWKKVKDNSIHYNLNTEKLWKNYIENTRLHLVETD